MELSTQRKKRWTILATKKKRPKPQKGGSVAVSTRSKTEHKTKKPRMYKVILLNDDFTTMDFVVHILEKFFHKSRAEATYLMLTVHHKGRAVVGIYPFEIAEMKVQQVITYARKNGHPLMCIMEPE